MKEWDKPLRTLNIKATPVLEWDGDDVSGAKVSYEETASNPPMPNAVNRETGDINLRHVPANNDFSGMINIIIHLDTSSLHDPGGNPIAGRFAQSDEGPMPGTGAIWLCNVPPPNKEKDITPIQVPMMVLGHIGDYVVTIVDGVAVGGPPYAFCMGLVLPDHGNKFVLIDPVISTRGVGGADR